MRYIFNDTRLSFSGTYEYAKLSLEEAREWAQAGSCLSTLRYPATARALEILLGVDVSVGDKKIFLHEGDEALIFRFKIKDAGNSESAETIAANCELGLLRFVPRVSTSKRGQLKGDEHGRTKVTETQLDWAWREYEAGRKSGIELAEELGVEKSTLYKAFKKRRK